MGVRSTWFFGLIAAAMAASACGAVADPNVEAHFNDGGHGGDTSGGGDSFVGGDSFAGDATDSAIVDSGHLGDSSTGVDTFVDDTFVGVDSGTGVDTAPVDTGAPDTGKPDTGPPPSDGGVGDFVFPKTGDKHSMLHDPYMWNAGDYVEGTRTTTLASATSLSGTFDVTNSLAAGGFIDVDVYLNGKKVGSFTFSNTSGSSIPLSMSFAAVAGPTYDIKYLETNTVAPGAGSVTITYDVAHVTLK